MKESAYNITMKKVIIPILVVIALCISIWLSLWFWTNKWYQNYVSLSEYRRLHPELMPSPLLIRAFDMWHTTSYASWMWLSLVQYIGDNIRDNRFLDFSHTMLEDITTLHPYFSRAYEIDLIFAPVSTGENDTPEKKAKNKIITDKAIELGEKWIIQLCDSDKIEKIKNQQISEDLWNDTSLKNPCPSGMLAYYMGFDTYQMGEDKTKASEYYKIASMNDDTPKWSRILSILSLSAEWDHMASALNFAVIGSTGYDIEPYSCQELANSLIRDIAQKKEPDISWINELQSKEAKLRDTRDNKNPISNSSNNCYDMTTRSIKEVYLSYITERAKGTSAKNGDELIQLWRIESIPTLSTQSGYLLKKRNDIWIYQAR